MQQYVTKPEKANVKANTEKDTIRSLTAEYALESSGITDFQHEVVYRLYKRRFTGLIALVGHTCCSILKSIDPCIGVSEHCCSYVMAVVRADIQ